MYCARSAAAELWVVCTGVVLYYVTTNHLPGSLYTPPPYFYLSAEHSNIKKYSSTVSRTACLLLGRIRVQYSEEVCCHAIERNGERRDVCRIGTSIELALHVG